MDPKLAALERLIEIVETLRGPNGCPWDRAQTLTKMPRYLIEESAEVADAIELAGGEPSEAVCEELGDVLMNVLLAARIAEERSAFSIGDVSERICKKLVRRHPHVFGDDRIDDVEGVLERWNEIKATEKASAGDRGAESRLAKVPRGLPPLLRAEQLGREAAKVGFDWPDAGGALAKVDEELTEVREALRAFEGGQPSSDAEVAADRDKDALESELGDLLFAVANLCRKVEVAPDAALRRTLRKFEARFRYIEEHQDSPENATLEELEALWERAKTDSKEGA